MIPVHVDHEKPFDSAELDPGIRKTVLLLRHWGFNTTDSGDGATKLVEGYDPQCVLPFPHVAVVCEPDELVKESKRLLELLENAGVEMGELDEDWGNADTLPSIEASYSPFSEVAIILLANVSDASFSEAVLNQARTEA